MILRIKSTAIEKMETEVRCGAGKIKKIGLEATHQIFPQSL
jgi:hypothetical protein